MNLAMLHTYTEDMIMEIQDKLVDIKVIRRLVQDIGLKNTQLFIQSLDNEFHKRIINIRQALDEKSFAGLAAEAHALKSSAQLSGAFKLAGVLTDLEKHSRKEHEKAFELAQEALTMTDLTRFAFLDIKLTD